MQPIESISDEPFLQEYREPFVAWPQPVENARVGLAVDASGTVWAAGPWGVQRLVDGTWQPPDGHKLDGPAFAIASEDDIVWVAGWDGLYRIDGGKLVRAALEGEPLGLVRMSAGRLFAGGPGGIWERRGNRWEPVPGNYSRSLDRCCRR